MSGQKRDGFYTYLATASKRYPAGRRCVVCRTRLSVYNPGERCGAHERTQQELYYCGYRFHQCPTCGTVIAAKTAVCRECREKARAS